MKIRTVENGKASSAGTKIVNHLKCGHKKREVIIDPEVTERFVRYIVEKVEVTGQNCDEWLFTRPDGCRMTESNIMHAMQNVNRNAKIKQRGNHASFETTQKYYAFARKEEIGKSERIGQVVTANFNLGLTS